MNAFSRALVTGLFLVAAQVSLLRAQESVSLLDEKDPTKGWTFNNGQEFPGATGGISVDKEVGRNGKPSLKLTGDFTKGGVYVDAGKKFDPVDIRELSLWLRNPENERLTLRIIDATGQCHQIALKTDKSDEWQNVVLPLERFFTRRGQADAVQNVAKYESWGGAKDGKWHGPATALYIVTGKPDANKVRTFWLNEATILSKPLPVAGADITQTVKLDEIEDGAHDWRFSKGEEFKGANGSLKILADQPAAGQSAFELSGDFTGGGAYCAMIKKLDSLDAQDLTALRLRYKSGNAKSITLMLVDGAGQTHQKKGLKLTADNQWHDLVVKPVEITGGEHWGGPNDGKWHAGARELVMSVTNTSADDKKPVLAVAGIQADIARPVYAQAATFKVDFESSAQLPANWTATDKTVNVDAQAGYQSRHSLKLARTVDQTEQATAVTTPAFTVNPGQWNISFVAKAELTSPDNSYHAVVQLHCLDSAGKVVDRLTVAEIFGKRDWQPVDKRVELPAGVKSAKLHIQLNKTYGQVWFDNLSAAFLAPALKRDDRIVRLMFSTAQVGNLLFPNDPRTVTITLEAKKRLREAQKTLTFDVRDYWGDPQTPVATLTLGEPEKKGERFVYTGKFDLATAPLEVGRYYEIHAAVTQPGEEPYTNYSSFAILPEAVTKQFKPEEIPFTSRNWDNRITEYIQLSDRLGIRVVGLWGGWTNKPPYKPTAPQLELVQKLGLGWLTGTPIHNSVEMNKKDYDEQALRQGAKNFIETYGKARPLVNLGNEPHGTGERVLNNVAAYKAVYEEIKKVDPTITVVATSVEPNEEYFKAGYQNYCDVFDFHIYEEYPNVRRTLKEYQALMKKYNCQKPIWSTELGLNSQGMTRLQVASELPKKFATFFAAGGANVSWFAIVYPDAEGKSAGSSGEAHNVFDCRYNKYAPRLDAVAYYNAVNAIGNKKFTTEQVYPNGINAFLFRDQADHSLIVLWKDKGREDVLLPLAGVTAVKMVRIDGRIRSLNAWGKGLTLTVTPDPVLLVFEGGGDKLPDALGVPAAKITNSPTTISAIEPTTLSVQIADKLTPSLVGPTLWKVTNTRASAAGTAAFTLTPATGSPVREVECLVPLADDQGRVRGELQLRVPAAR